MARESKSKRGSGRKTVSIIVDGDTEVWYFQMLRESENLGQLAVKPELPGKKTIEYQFKMVSENALKYDQVIWLLDFDTIIKESREAKASQKVYMKQFNDFKRRASEIQNVDVLVNTPCLEFWFLLHEIHTGKFYAECEPVAGKLSSSKILSGYTKTEKYFKNSKTNIYQRLKPYLGNAMKNAEKLGDFNIDDPNSAKAETFKIFNILGVQI